MHGGNVVPSAIVLSHDEQYERLGSTVPEALGAAVIAGDPCFDRMMASEHNRHRYREALGAVEDTTVVLVSSTWGADSLFGRAAAVIAELLAELEMDQHVVAAVLHPNVWSAHGPKQIRLWLGDCLRAGLRLVPPDEGWQQAVLASDVVIGDNGATTGYAAAAGRATLLAAYPDQQVAEGSAIEELGRVARRLDPRRPYRPQLETAMADAAAGRLAGVRDLVSSVPGESAQHLRRVFYMLMDLPEPAGPALVPQYAATALAPETTSVRAWWATGELAGEREAWLRRWPADVAGRDDQPPYSLDCHLVVAADHPRRDLIGNAAIVISDDHSSPAEVFQQRPSCVLVVRGDVVVHRSGNAVTVATNCAGPDAVNAAASAIYLWLATGGSPDELPDVLVLRSGRRAISATLVPIAANG